MATRKGPVYPKRSAVKLATRPAATATMPLPRVAWENLNERSVFGACLECVWSVFGVCVERGEQGNERVRQPEQDRGGSGRCVNE